MTPFQIFPNHIDSIDIIDTTDSHPQILSKIRILKITLKLQQKYAVEYNFSKKDEWRFSRFFQKTFLALSK